MNKRIIVTGSNGFLGKNLVPFLLKKGYRIQTIDRRRTARSVHVGDIGRGLPSRLFTRCNAVVHLAARVGIDDSLREPSQRIEQNVRSTLMLLEAVRASGKRPIVVFASTDRVYGATRHARVDEREPAFPIEPYTASKIMSETLVQLYGHLYDIPYVILRFDSVYGPHQPHSMFISDIIRRLRTEREVKTGSLATRKNFLYVEDACAAIETALKSKNRARGQIYNVAGVSASLRDVAGIAQALVAQERGQPIRVREGAGQSRMKKAEVLPFSVSITKADKLLGWKPRITLRAGIKRTADFFLRHEE